MIRERQLITSFKIPSCLAMHVGAWLFYSLNCRIKIVRRWMILTYSLYWNGTGPRISSICKSEETNTNPFQQNIPQM
jgi:hypothetical protein